MRGLTGRIARAAAAAVLLAAGLSAVSAQSSFAAACTYNGCSGKDPQTTGCAADARNLADRLNEWGDRMELRYSPSCGAVWTRLTTTGCWWSHAQLETGYIDYYGTYHRQGLFVGKTALCTDGTRTGWTPMSSYRRERLKISADNRGGSYTYLTGCNDCY